MDLLRGTKKENRGEEKGKGERGKGKGERRGKGKRERVGNEKKEVENGKGKRDKPLFRNFELSPVSLFGGLREFKKMGEEKRGGGRDTNR